MKNISPELASYVEQQIIPRYEHFDAAHRTDHVRTVIRESLDLASHYDLDTDMVYATAAFHDTGLAFGRDNHHLDSGKIVRHDAFLQSMFDTDRLEIIAEAVEDHRASHGSEPRSIYGKIVSEADRIIIPEVCIRRTIQYGIEHYPKLGRNHQYLRFESHLREKYGRNGYIRFWIPYSANKTNLEELRDIIDNSSRLHYEFDKVFDTIIGR